MAFHPFIKIRLPLDGEITAKHINLVQDAVAAAVNQIVGKDQLDFAVLRNVTLTPSGPNYVAHKLGRRVRDVFAAVPQSVTGTSVWLASGATQWPLPAGATYDPYRTVPLLCGATGIFSLMVM